jgi:hypothetical protein
MFALVPNSPFLFICNRLDDVFILFKGFSTKVLLYNSGNQKNSLVKYLIEVVYLIKTS